MNAILSQTAVTYQSPQATLGQTATFQAPTESDDQSELKEYFQKFVGQTLFGQMLQSMRRTQEDIPYFGGSRAEKIFQQQLDQVLVEKLSDSSAEKLSEPMFELFQLRRQ